MNSRMSYVDLLKRTDAPSGSSWNLFADGDQLGMLNNLTPDRVKDAVTLVRSGTVFNLDYPLNTFVPSLAGTRPATVHNMFSNNPNHRDDWLDSFYLQSTSQIDGLRHIRHPEHGFYGGVPDSAISADSPDLGIQLVAERGIVGRGVLLDVLRYCQATNTPYDLTGNQSFGPQDLDRIVEHQGVELRPGDILLIHLGWAEHYLGLSDDGRKARTGTPGLVQSDEMLAWLWDHELSFIAADNGGVEAFPVRQDSGWVDPLEPLPPRGPVHNGMLHRPLLGLLGLMLGELWYLDKLAASCAADGIYDFMLTAKPLNLIGGVGSPPNAMAIK